MILNFNKPKFLKSGCCDDCCDILEPYILLFENEDEYEGDFDKIYICLKCMIKRGMIINENLKKKLLLKQRKLQIKYYESKLKKLKGKN